MANSMGFRGYDYIEFYVGSARMVAWWFVKGLGMDVVGYSGPETGVRDRASYYLCKNDLKFLVTAPLHPTSAEVQDFIHLHGDGVKRWAIEVDSVEGAFSKAIKNRGIPIQNPTRLEDEHGFVEQAAIRLYDDTEIVFINRDNYKGIFKPGFGKPVQQYQVQREDTLLNHVDHIVGNVRTNEMDRWADYFNQSFDFETFVDFGPGDISTRFSALLSKVVRSKDSVIKNPINEPYEGIKKSQIEEYLDHYYGSGVQHIAIETPNIIESIAALRANGIEFLSVPDTYYEDLRARNHPIKQDIAELQKYGILCDTEGKGYLLQLFTKPIGDRPTFFFEIIQRCDGAEGFGQGNFQALFESIERDQELRGNLT